MRLMLHYCIWFRSSEINFNGMLLFTSRRFSMVSKETTNANQALQECGLVTSLQGDFDMGFFCVYDIDFRCRNTVLVSSLKVYWRVVVCPSIFYFPCKEFCALTTCTMVYITIWLWIFGPLTNTTFWFLLHTQTVRLAILQNCSFLWY